MFCLKAISQGVLINEFLSDNNAGLKDADGDFNDWIELYNTSNQAIPLLNYGLSDDLEQLDKWTFPDVSIQAKEYLLIFASGKEKQSNTELHSNFKIKQSGEPLILSNQLGNVLSKIEPVFVATDKSFARLTDGSEQMAETNLPTPNLSNLFLGVYCSHPSGFYEDDFRLSLVNSNTKQQIYYTLNGNTPTVNSTLYSAPIHVKNNQQSPLSYSIIPTTPLTGEPQLNDFIWKAPQQVYQCNTIRYGVFENDSLIGKIQTKNYFVDPEMKGRYQFPITAIVTDSTNLFDYETGIYIPGKQFDIDGFNWWPTGNYLNRGRLWERAIHLSYFDENGNLAFETDAGMRMRGLGSAANPQKSFMAYFRKEYGRSTIDYPIFKNRETEKYKRLVFRNSGNDFIYTHFRDAMLQKIIEPMDLELQAFQPTVVFLNGEYWGIHNIREKYDEYYFKYNLGVDEEDVNILSFCGLVEEGSNIEYNQLINFVETHDLSVNENYEYVIERIDLQNFIDFQIAEIYFANYDWPCNNYKIWKDNQPDSKWRFLIYDLDFSFGYDYRSSYSTSSIEHATRVENDWPHCECANLIFRKLLQNEAFKNQFLKRFSYCLDHIFKPSKILKTIDDFEQLYTPEIEEHIARWNYPPNIEQWKLEIDKLRLFATKRLCKMTNYINTFFDVNTVEIHCVLNNVSEDESCPIFPNPNNGEFILFNNSKRLIENGSISITNITGKTVYRENRVSLKLNEQYLIQLKNQPSGVYLFQFTSETLSERKKIVLQ